LKRLKKDEPVDADPEILNTGLDLAMEWGPNWLAAIQARLAERHPGLNAAELDAYDAACRTAMRWGHAQVAEHWQAANRDGDEASRRFEAAVREQYPWMSEKNLSHLFSQGCYYAWKDGGL
jgi:hypothetical protein